MIKWTLKNGTVLHGVRVMICHWLLTGLMDQFTALRREIEEHRREVKRIQIKCAKCGGRLE